MTTTKGVIGWLHKCDGWGGHSRVFGHAKSFVFCTKGSYSHATVEVK